MLFRSSKFQISQYLVKPATPALKTLQCFAGQHWQWDKVQFEVLYPSLESYQDTTLSDNNKSCVLKVTSQYGSILLTGDIEKQAENLLLQASQQAQLINHSNANFDATPQFSLKSDVLTAPHHGSKTSSTLAFIQAVDAKYAVFSVGYLNRFKHPKDLIEKRYEQNGLHYPDSKNYRSDYHGALIFSFTQTKPLQVQAWRQTHPKYWHNQVAPVKINQQ